MKMTAKRNFSLFHKERVEASASGEPQAWAPSELDTDIHQLLTAETKQFNPCDDDDDDNEDIGLPLQGESIESESKSW